jgi:PAS domain S-box-containing protein
MNTTVYILGIVLQSIAAIIALVQVRRAPRKLPWLLIGLSSLLIVARRAATLEQFMRSGRELAAAEVLTLLISLLFFLGVVLMSRMFSEAQKAHAALVRSEENLRLKNLVFETSIAAESIANPDGFLTDANAAFLRIWGYGQKAEVLGRHIQGFLTKPSEMVAMMAALNQAGQWEGDYSAKRKDGTNFIAHGLATVVRDENGRLLGYQSAVLDITQRRQTEEAAARAAREWETTFSAANDAIWLLDNEQHVVRSNRIADQLFQRPCGSAAGHHCWELAHGTSGPIPGCPMMRARKSLHRETMELQIGERWYLVTADPILDASHHYAGAVHIVRDITERKQAEGEKEQQEAKNRQFQKSESLARMAAAIAHHFNNQLQAVMMGLELAMDEVTSGAEHGQFLNQSLESARKAAEMSSLMLVYLGQSVCKRELLDLSVVCRRHLPLLRIAVPPGIALETALPSSGPVVSADEAQLQQVLANLVTNAAEAAGDGRSPIRLTVKTVPAASIAKVNRFPIDIRLPNPDYACLEVADSGLGIPSEDIEKIFDPFFSTKFTGRGLGLSVVLGIVKTLAGAITVESEVGKGSVFRIFLPLSTLPIPRRPSTIAPTGGGTRESGTVLLVEDDPTVRLPVARALQRFGYTVLEAADGAEAVELFRQHTAAIRCVLCDLAMPGMDGWATMEAMRKLSPGIPVILASGYSEAEVMAGEHPERPQAFLGKPYDIKELGKAINQILAP